MFVGRKKKRHKKEKKAEEKQAIDQNAMEQEPVSEPLSETSSEPTPDLLETPSLSQLPAGLAPVLDGDENVIVLISGLFQHGKAYLGLTAKRSFFFRSSKFGVEITECRLRYRPLVDSIQNDDGWMVTVTLEHRVLELRQVAQNAAARFCEAIDKQISSLGVGSDSWETMAADHNLWDEMRHYITPKDGAEAKEEGKESENKEDGGIDELQQNWIKKGALKSPSAWWPPSAATLVWLIPLLLLLWMVHTIIIASTADPSTMKNTNLLLSRARRGDERALNQLAFRLPKEKNAEKKISIARLLAQNSPPGAADMLLQDIFSQNTSAVRQAEIQTLFKLNLGRELVARITQPGSLELKKALIIDLGDFGDTSIASDLKEYYHRSEQPLRPILLRTLARLGQDEFLVETYRKGTTEVREDCLDAVYSLEPKARKKALEACLECEVAAERRKHIESLLKR